MPYKDKEKRRAYYAAHREEIRARDAAYYAAHREEQMAYRARTTAVPRMLRLMLAASAIAQQEITQPQQQAG